jgi:hypothetical protein
MTGRVALSLVSNALRLILDRLHYALTRPSGLAEIASGLGTFCWGALVLRGLDNIRVSVLAEFLIRVSPSSVWGLTAMVLGLGQMFGFAVIDRRWRRPWLRLIAAFMVTWLRSITALMVAWLWGAMCMSYISQDGEAIPPVVGGLIALWFINVYLIFRIVPPRAGQPNGRMVRPIAR